MIGLVLLCDATIHEEVKRVKVLYVTEQSLIPRDLKLKNYKNFILF